MTKEKKEQLIRHLKYNLEIGADYLITDEDAVEIIKALEQQPRKGEWLRMSDLPEREDDRYKCSRCGNVIRHKDKMNLYTFNSWCGRCGSNNGR